MPPPIQRPRFVLAVVKAPRPPIRRRRTSPYGITERALPQSLSRQQACVLCELIASYVRLSCIGIKDNFCSRATAGARCSLWYCRHLAADGLASVSSPQVRYAGGRSRRVAKTDDSASGRALICRARCSAKDRVLPKDLEPERLRAKLFCAVQVGNRRGAIFTVVLPPCPPQTPRSEHLIGTSRDSRPRSGR